jgi:DNA-directed RNA polymerase I subunit RPA2
MNCSDYSTAWVCRNCGSLITLGFDKSLGGDEAGKEYCRVCDKEDDGVKIEDGSNKISVNVRGKKDRKGVMDVIAVPCKSSLLVSKTGGVQLTWQMCSDTYVPRWPVWASSLMSPLHRRRPS